MAATKKKPIKPVALPSDVHDGTANVFLGKQMIGVLVQTVNGWEPRWHRLKSLSEHSVWMPVAGTTAPASTLEDGAAEVLRLMDAQP